MQTFELSGVLKQITIKAGKEDEEGIREPAKAIIQFEVPVSRSLGTIGFFVGQEVKLQIQSLQMALLPMEVAES